ncbi:hypothetical protein [Undibacterium sp.]|jgi:hypothetical protein|uniref:hypothetical protein n=1 Tax=Undibacterium sp. TaxID=1914977 RepID=UPI002BED6360|nr:hypothetical protein [Undibacterium sp.]HTD06250.1 hypothetical protein [Undibacterium sp.]
MKSKDFVALAKRLLPNMPGFAVKGPMVAMLPVKFAVRGIYFEGSSFDTKSFYVWVFFLPLFVPTSNVSFNLGRRLRVPAGGDRWSTDMPNLMGDLAAAVERDALPFLSGIESPLDIAKAAEKIQAPKDPYVQQAIAYAWARAGDTARACDELGKLVRLLDSKIPWQHAMSDRAEGLKAKLLESPMEAKAQLEAWEVETVQGLGLDNFK